MPCLLHVVLLLLRLKTGDSSGRYSHLLDRERGAGAIFARPPALFHEESYRPFCCGDKPPNNLPAVTRRLPSPSLGKSESAGVLPAALLPLRAEIPGDTTASVLGCKSCSRHTHPPAAQAQQCWQLDCIQLALRARVLARPGRIGEGAHSAGVETTGNLPAPSMFTYRGCSDPLQTAPHKTKLRQRAGVGAASNHMHVEGGKTRLRRRPASRQRGDTQHRKSIVCRTTLCQRSVRLQTSARQSRRATRNSVAGLTAALALRTHAWASQLLAVTLRSRWTSLQFPFKQFTA